MRELFHLQATELQKKSELVSRCRASAEKFISSQAQIISKYFLVVFVRICLKLDQGCHI